MITPLDIQNKAFSKVVRGYKEEEVDAFLDLITLDMEKLLEENLSLRNQEKKYLAEIDKYKQSQGSVYETLESAKALMQDISASAEKRAEMVLKNAELEAEVIQKEAKESVVKLHDEYSNLKASFDAFKKRYKSMLEAELDKFDTLSAEIFTDKDIFDQKNTLFSNESYASNKKFVTQSSDANTLLNIRGEI